jgi:hypothetical protein
MPEQQMMGTPYSSGGDIEHEVTFELVVASPHYSYSSSRFSWSVGSCFLLSS